MGRSVWLWPACGSSAMASAEFEVPPTQGGRHRVRLVLAVAALAVAALAALLGRQAPGPSEGVAASLPSLSNVPGLPAAPVTVRLRTRPLSRWLDDLARQAGLGLVLAPGLDGQFVASEGPADSRWRQRLDAMSRVYGFSYRLGESYLEVVPVAGELEEASGQVSGQPGFTVVPLARANPTRMAGLLGDAARELGVVLVADSAAKVLVAQGPEEGAARLARLVERLDASPATVVLEAEIVELTRAARTELGVEWSLDGSLLVAKSGRADLEAKLSALESSGRVRVVSRPRLVTEEGSSALIESVRILRIRLPERAPLSETAGPAGGRAVESIPVGVTLSVEPSVEADGRVRMLIEARSSTLGTPQPPDGIPEELARRLRCTATVASGETLVLGGLLRSADRSSGSGLPLLGSLPLLGPLFGSTERSSDGEELLVVVTPTVVWPGTD